MNSSLQAAGKDHTYQTSSSCMDAMCIFYAVTNTIILVLGITGNGLVIWIAGFKMKKSVITTWYLSLAMADFIFCWTLPFGVVHKVTNTWIFGLFMCKFRFFILFVNMYSSIFILTIISLDRCLTIMFPVWAQNQRTVKKASVIVIVIWIISAVLSSPELIFRDIQEDKTTKRCVNTLQNNEEKHFGRVASRFGFGFAIPFTIIVICYVAIMQKLRSNHMAKSKKPFKIMTLLIVTFLICWLPFHTFSFLQIKDKEVFKTGKTVGITFANANSFLNPFLYAFMGKGFKKSCYAIWLRVEHAIQEESPYRVQGIPISTSGENKLSSTVVQDL